MKPIYFPYTYMPVRTMEALGVFFSQVVAYQPSHLPVPAEVDALVQGGRLAIRVPVTADSDNLGQVVKAYQTWAHQHQGAEFAYFKTQQGAIPFYDDASIHQIRTQIRRTQQDYNRPSEPVEEAAQQLMQARVFLHLSQEFDSQNWTISDSLKSQANMERAMLQGLQGEADGDESRLLTTQTFGADQPGEYMIAERLAAWGALLPHDPDMTGVFVTDSRSALATVLDDRSGVVEIGQWTCTREDCFDHQPDWQVLFAQYVDRLVTETWPIDMPAQITLPAAMSEAQGVTLTLYLVPGTNPYEFWRGGTGQRTSNVSETSVADRYRNTVVALIVHRDQTCDR